MATNRKHSNEFKEKVVKEYLNGERHGVILRKFNISKSSLNDWVKKYKKYGTFPDGRGKSLQGRPKAIKVDKDGMTKDEYIAYLEMENDILKYLHSLRKKKQK